MRRPSSTWLSSAALALLVACAASPAGARLCLPGVFEGGRRLQRIGAVTAFWIEPLLRQHALCWRKPAADGEWRVVAVGNSTVLGFPNPADQTVWGVLNRRFEDADPPAHFFNLGFAFTYQLKEVLILREVMKYEPDLVVYGITFDDMRPVVPAMYPPTVEFMRANKAELIALAAEEPPGVGEPLARYREHLKKAAPAWYLELRELGTFARILLQEGARALRRWPVFGGDGSVEWDEPHIAARKDYDCEEIVKGYELWFSGWRDWNVLAYLEWLQQRFGVPIVVVNWPVAFEPRGICHNARYTTEGLEEHRAWLREQSAAHGLEFVDLHGLLPTREFVDSLHPTARGQAIVAEALEPKLRELLRGRPRREGGSQGAPRPGE